MDKKIKIKQLVPHASRWDLAKGLEDYVKLSMKACDYLRLTLDTPMDFIETLEFFCNDDGLEKVIVTYSTESKMYTRIFDQKELISLEKLEFPAK